MAHKRYTIADDTYARLQTGISATTTTINISPPSESWARNFVGDNTIATLAQYDTNGNISKKEKVYITGISGNVLTVSRGYLGDTPQSFNNGDYIFLNIVSEHLSDIHTRIDEVETDIENKRQVLQEQIDDIYTEGDRRLRVYRLPTDNPLAFRVGAGGYIVGSAVGVFAGGTYSAPNNSTKKISLNKNGVVEILDDWNDEKLRLAEIVARDGRIISIKNWKTDAVGGKIGGSGGGFINISNIVRDERGFLKTFTGDNKNYTITRRSDGRVSRVSGGGITKTINYDVQGKIISIT